MLERRHPNHEAPESFIRRVRTDETAGDNSLKQIFLVLGPGVITGASDDDPSGIATYSMAGASLGYTTLWTALVTFPLMAAVQFICAKIGLVSGMGLAGIMRRNYSRWIIYPAILGLVAANTINAAADIQAVAAGINLLLPIPIALLIAPIAVLILIVQVWGSYRVIANIFRWLALSLLAYIGAAFLAKPDWSQVARGTLLPTMKWDSDFISMLVAILGTTISPYLFFWQASQEVDEQKEMGRKHLWQRQGATRKELKYAAWDVNAGMFSQTSLCISSSWRPRRHYTKRVIRKLIRRLKPQKRCDPSLVKEPTC